MSIYNDVQQLEELINSCANEETGEISEDDFAAFQELKTETIANGLELLAKVRANKLGNIDSIDAEISRLAKRKNQIAKAVDSVENYMTYLLNTHADKKVKTDLFTFGFRKSKSVSIADENLIPDEYVIVKNTRSPDKTRIKAAIESGDVVTGASIVEKQNLQIS